MGWVAAEGRSACARAPPGRPNRALGPSRVARLGVVLLLVTPAAAVGRRHSTGPLQTACFSRGCTPALCSPARSAGGGVVRTVQQSALSVSGPGWPHD